jgi:hypothetical protein
MAIRSTFDTTTNKDLLKEGGLRKLFDNTVREAKVFYKELVNDLKTSDEYVRDQRMAGLNGATELVEGQEIPIQKPVLGTAKTYTQRQFGSGFRMTNRMDKFNKYNLWSRWSKDLGKCMKEAKDVEVHVMFNSPTSATLTCGVGFDTLALAHDTHTGLLAGSTTDNYDNYLNASLSISALESARYYFKTRKDDMGMYVGGDPTHLVIEPTLFITAKEILGSDLKAHELSNTTNVIKDEMSGLKVYENPRITSTTAWFMLDKNAKDFDINVFTAQEPDFVTMDAPDTTRDRIATSLQYFTYGFGYQGAAYWGKL